jgi:hypothetical protein
MCCLLLQDEKLQINLKLPSQLRIQAKTRHDAKITQRIERRGQAALAILLQLAQASLHLIETVLRGSQVLGTFPIFVCDKNMTRTRDHSSPKESTRFPTATLAIRFSSLRSQSRREKGMEPSTTPARGPTTTLQAHATTTSTQILQQLPHLRRPSTRDQTLRGEPVRSCMTKQWAARDDARRRQQSFATEHSTVAEPSTLGSERPAAGSHGVGRHGT